jgi:hypothetical protein
MAQITRIEQALDRIERVWPNDSQAQVTSLRAELIYSAFLTSEDRAAFRREIDERLASA